MRHLASLTLVALLPVQAALMSSPEDTEQRCLVAPDVPVAPTPLTGCWTLACDDTTDLELTSHDKACRIELTDVHGTLVGHFDGPVLGRERAAVFTGEALPVRRRLSSRSCNVRRPIRAPTCSRARARRASSALGATRATAAARSS